MSRIKDLMDENTSAAFRDKVMAAARPELKKLRRRESLCGFWAMAFSSTFGFAIVSWLFHNAKKTGDTDRQLIAVNDEILENYELLDDLEILEHLENEGIEI